MAVVKVRDAIAWTDRYYGLSTDTKPTGVPIGSRFIETNTGKVFETADGTNWFQLVV